MIDLTDEQLDMRRTVRRFATERVAPLAEAADRADGHLARQDFADIMSEAASFGLTSLMLPGAFGGADGSTVDNVVVQEELGAVDVGIAGALNLVMTIPNMIAVGGTAEQQSTWLTRFATAERGHVLAGALNEPDVAGSELFCPVDDASLGLRTTATRTDAGYRIDGAKAGWVSNGGVADTYLVFARTAFDAPAAATTSAFLVPADSPGVQLGSRSEMLGMRTTWHAEVVFDGVEVPESHRVGEEGRGLELMGAASAGMAVGLASGFVGLARSALAASIAYADERRSWGKPIRQHQAVSLKLGDMAVELETARLLVHHAAVAVDRGDPSSMWRVPAAKTHAVDVAIACAERAVQIHGAMGVARGVGPEKWLRDAWTGYACDFTRDVLRLQIADTLTTEIARP
ncbi:MAG: acyl-CoA dehydrogenase family protein [Ilumatobacter sp.]|uniref:acyl-CoA dehydrogenase family protein n=1 Tax=Ilumatobacter sp. TaxID=1967498 RepID=UPI00391C9501